MPHLPTTQRERKDAYLERKVERIQRDQRLQWLRTMTARRALVVLSALLTIGVVPAFVLGGSTVGILTTAAGFGSWWLLRRSVRLVADLPDRFLDERQRKQRDRAYFDAFRIYASLIGGLATLALIGFVVAQVNDEVSITITWQEAIGTTLFVLLLSTVLPSMALAWREVGELVDGD